MYKFMCRDPDDNYLFGIHLDSNDVFSEGQQKLSKQADLNFNSSNYSLENTLLSGPVVISTEKIKNDNRVCFADQNELNDFTPHFPVDNNIHPQFPLQNSNWKIRNTEINPKKKSIFEVDFSLKLEDPGRVTASKVIAKQNRTLDEHEKQEKMQLLFPRCKLNKPPLSKSDLQELFSLTSYSSENSRPLVSENLVEPIELKAKLCTKLEQPHNVSKLYALKPKQTAKVIEKVVKEQDSLFGNLLATIDEQIMGKKDQKKNKNKEIKIKKDVTKDNKSDKTEKDIELKHKKEDIVVNKNDSCKEKKDLKSNHHIKHMCKYSKHSTRHEEYEEDFKNKEHESKSKDLTKIKDSDSKNKYDLKSKDTEIKITDKELIPKSKTLKHKANKPKTKDDKDKTGVKSKECESNIKKSTSKHNESEYKEKKAASSNSKYTLEKCTEIKKVDNSRRPSTKEEKQKTNKTVDKFTVLSSQLLKIDDKEFEHIPFKNNIYNQNNMFTPIRDQFRTYQLTHNQDQYRIRQDHFRPKKDQFLEQFHPNQGHRPRSSDQSEQNQNQFRSNRDQFRRIKNEIDKENVPRRCRYEDKNTPENKTPPQDEVKCKHYGKWRFKEKVKNPNIELKEESFSNLNNLHSIDAKPIVGKRYDIQDEVEENKSVEKNKVEEIVEESKRAQNECDQNDDKEKEVKTNHSTGKENEVKTNHSNPEEETGIPKIEAAFLDEQLNMFQKFMKHIFNTCDSSFLLQYLEKCGISLSQSRNKRVRRIIYSDSESEEEITREKENKQAEKVKGEETSRAKESEQQILVKLQDEENLIVSEAIRNPKRKHRMYSSDSSSEKQLDTNGESLVKDKIVTTKSMKVSPRKRSSPLEVSQDNLRSDNRMCKIIKVHEEHGLCDVLNNSKNKEKDYVISDVPLTKLKIVKNRKTDSVISEDNNLPEDDFRSGDRMNIILKEHEEQGLSDKLIQSKNKKDYISDDDLPLAKRKTVKSPKNNLKQQGTLKKKEKKEDIREITTDKNKLLQRRLRSSRVFLEIINFSTESTDEENSTYEKEKKKEATFVEPEVSLGVKPKKKRRGRPRKIFEKSSVSLSKIELDLGVEQKKKRRGRPRKIFEKSSLSLSKIESGLGVKPKRKRRGRPRKIFKTSSVSLQKIESKTTENETIEFETVKCAGKEDKKTLFNKRRNYSCEMNKINTLSFSQSTGISSQLPITGSVNEYIEVEAKLPQLPQSQISDDEYALFKIDLRSDIYYFLDNGNRFDCKLCDYKGKFIVNHYRTRHPESENLISRLNPDEAEKAQIESKLNKFEEIKPFEEKEYGKKREMVFVCRFCNIYLKTKVSTFVDHVCCHTGEYRYLCKLCPFVAKNKITLSNHCYNFHPELKKPLKLTPIWPSPPNFRIMFGYLCKACNFTQILKKNIENHINVSHLGQNIEIIKISMSSQSVSLDDINTTKNIETKLDEIEKSREKTPDMTGFVQQDDIFSNIISELPAHQLNSILYKVEDENTSIDIENHPIEAIHSEEISNLMKELFPPQNFSLKTCNTKTEPNNEENEDISPEKDTIKIASNCNLAGLETPKTENEDSQIRFEDDETTELRNEEEDMHKSEKEVYTSNIERTLSSDSAQDFNFKICNTIILAETESNNDENEDILPEKDTIRIANICSLAGLESSETENEDSQVNFEDNETTKLPNEEEKMHDSEKDMDTSNVEHTMSTDINQNRVHDTIQRLAYLQTPQIPKNNDYHSVNAQFEQIEIKEEQKEESEDMEKNMSAEIDPLQEISEPVVENLDLNPEQSQADMRFLNIKDRSLTEEKEYNVQLLNMQNTSSKLVDLQNSHLNLQIIQPNLVNMEKICKYKCSVKNNKQTRPQIQGEPEIETVCYKISEEHEAAASLSQDNTYEVTSPVPHRTFNITPLTEMIDDNVQIYYTCIHCAKKSNELDEIRSHFFENHSRTNAASFKYKKVSMDKSKKLHYKCNYCEWFADPESLKQHCSIIHNDKIWVPQRNTKLKCIICAQMFAQLNTIKKHFKVQHSSEDLSFHTLLEDGMVLDKTEFLKEDQILIICNYCRDQFDNRTELFNHHSLSHSHLQFKEPGVELNKEEVPKKFKCPECGHSSNSYDAMRQHLMNHLGKPVRCIYCNARFYYPSNLKNHHVRKHRDLLLLINKVPKFAKQMEKITGAMLHLNQDGTYSTKNKLKRPKNSRELNEPPTKMLVLDRR